MKHIIFVLVIICAINFPLQAGIGKIKSSALYFITNTNTVLIYESSFGETKTESIRHGNLITMRNEFDRFKYYQKFSVNERGFYIHETYQYIKLFLFLKKETSITYDKPLLRIPFPLSEGNKWNTSGIEFEGEDSNTVYVSGKVIGFEKIKTKAGNFETICIETEITGSGSSNNVITEWYAENIGLVKAKILIRGGGLMGVVRDILGYGQIDFELKEIRKE